MTQQGDGRPDPIPASAHPAFVDPLAAGEPAPGLDEGGIVALHVHRSFGSVHAVREMTFHAKPGRVTALIGPNGAGKTTLLLMLASLLAPDSGAIRIDGTDLTRLTHNGSEEGTPAWGPHPAKAATH